MRRKVNIVTKSPRIIIKQIIDRARSNNINNKLFKTTNVNLSRPLSEEQKQFLTSTNIKEYNLKCTSAPDYICPHCGGNHEKNYKTLTLTYICVGCRDKYKYPIKNTTKYIKPSVFDKLPIENPDWM